MLLGSAAPAFSLAKFSLGKMLSPMIFSAPSTIFTRLVSGSLSMYRKIRSSAVPAADTTAFFLMDIFLFPLFCRTVNLPTLSIAQKTLRVNKKIEFVKNNT